MGNVRADRRKIRREQASERAEAREKRTPQQQIEKLKREGHYYSTRPGGGLTKEAARLEALGNSGPAARGGK